jgi:chemotaxis protein methyltransferase CheR
LIEGETGTGKELVARAIHSGSLRKYRPLIKLDCTRLPLNLIESELFGHEKGAFTGAVSKRVGRFEIADGSTIFLDEVGDLPLELQGKLLQVLESGKFERLGSSQTIKTDARVIAATNRNLKKEVEKGAFREDLYYRMNVFAITIPPLRQRKEDIPMLVNAFVQRISKKIGKEINSIPKKTMETLQSYSWLGNIRELENVIERAVITSPGRTLQVELPRSVVVAEEEGKTLEDVEREFILRILNQKKWRISGPKGAALALGLHPETLRSRMKKLGIKRP